MSKTDVIASLKDFFKFMAQYGCDLCDEEDAKNGGPPLLFGPANRDALAVFNLGRTLTAKLELPNDESQRATILAAKELGWPDKQNLIPRYEKVVADREAGVPDYAPMPKNDGDEQQLSGPFSQPKDTTRYI